MFHAAGMYVFLSSTLYYETPIAFGFADRPLSSESVYECLEHLDVKGAMLP
jgi:hypothetical protein